MSRTCRLVGPPASLCLLVPLALVAPAAQDKPQGARSADARDDDVPAVVTRPAPPARAQRYVQLVVPAQDYEQDAGATLSPQDLEYLRQRLRTHGFDIDEKTGRPLFHAPIPPPGIGVYHPYAYDPRLFGIYPYGTDFRSAVDLYLVGREYERHDARRRFNQEDMTRRAHKLLAASEQALHNGLKLLKSGEYKKSLIALTLAAELDNGDAACRLHLAQARMALGHYRDAGQVLRRALQLQPRLVYVHFDLEEHYPRAADFDEQVDALAASAGDTSDADVLFLLGFMEFQRGNYDAAHDAFARADAQRPDDSVTRKFLEIVKPAER